MKKTILFGALAGVMLTSMAQEISLEGSPSSLRILPGAPAEFELTVRNTSGKPLTLVGQTLQRALFPNGLPGGRLYDWNGKAVRCSEGSGGLVVKGNKPPCETATVVFSAGGSWTVSCGIYSQGSCPIQEVPPGNYVGKVQVETLACVDGQEKVIRQELEIPVTILEPQAEDAAYLRALEEAIASADPKVLKGGSLKSRPLEWGEVLHTRRANAEALCLQRFPTSTYAGYVLARKLLDLSDWRFKVGTPASAIQAGKEHPEWATRSQSDVELFNLVEKHIQGGNVPESLRAVLYGYYGEQLILRGRAAEAEAAFCQAVKEKPGDAKGEAYFTRAQQFLEALRKHGE